MYFYVINSFTSYIIQVIRAKEKGQKIKSYAWQKQCIGAVY